MNQQVRRESCSTSQSQEPNIRRGLPKRFSCDTAIIGTVSELAKERLSWYPQNIFFQFTEFPH